MLSLTYSSLLSLTSGLPPEYESAVVTLNSVNLKDLTLEFVIGHLLNEEECQLSQKLFQDSKVVKGETEPEPLTLHALPSQMSPASSVGKRDIT